MKIKINYKFNRIWFSYFCIKIFYTFFALFVYSKFTLLGDSHSYLNGHYSDIKLMFISSNHFVGTIGHFFQIFMGPILANIPFTILSFYGVYYSVSRLNLNKKHLVTILFLMSLPSFGVWSSLCSKEAFGVFYMGILVGYIIDLLNNPKRKLKLIDYVALYIAFLIKPQYMLAVLSIIALIKISNLLSLKPLSQFALFCFYIIFVVVGFYTFRETINEVSFLMPTFFSEEGGATRINTFILKDYDVFYNAPYGMFLAFWGPTFNEVMNKPAQSIVFIESFIILAFYCYLLMIFILYFLKTYRLNIKIFYVMFLSVFWLLFVHYPFGIFNYGSALRYRENFYGFLVVLLFYVFLKIRKAKRIA